MILEKNLFGTKESALKAAERFAEILFPDFCLKHAYTYLPPVISKVIIAAFFVKNLGGCVVLKSVYSARCFCNIWWSFQ